MFPLCVCKEVGGVNSRGETDKRQREGKMLMKTPTPTKGKGSGWVEGL